MITSGVPCLTAMDWSSFNVIKMVLTGLGGFPGPHKINLIQNQFMRSKSSSETKHFQAPNGAEEYGDRIKRGSCP
jgi:hypothetical protein